MARDKGIVIRVELETREQLKKQAESYGEELGLILYKIVSRIAAGDLSISQLLTSSDIDNFSDSDIDEKINAAIAPLTKELATIKKH